VLTIRSVVVTGCDGAFSTMSSGSSAAAGLRFAGHRLPSSVQPRGDVVALLDDLAGAVKRTRQPAESAFTFSTITLPTNSEPR